MKARISILSLVVFLFLYSFVNAQDLPVACGGDLVRYGVVGTEGSAFVWEVEGGEIVENYNDSIDVRWYAETATRNISVTETNIYGCTGEPYYDQLLVSTPDLSFENDQDICEGGFYEFIATSSTDVNYTWQDGSTGDSYLASMEGYYTVTAIDEYGCSVSDSAFLEVHDNPVVDLGPDTMLCGDNPILELDAGNPGATYYWSTGDITQVIEVTQKKEDQEIWVDVMSEYGCFDTDTLLVELCNETEFLEIPSAFTPDGDGINERWTIEDLFVFEGVTVEVYNRWGNLVFESKGYSADQYWDGTDMRGNKLPMDSYYYIIDLGNGEKPKVGNVTIIR